MRDDELITITGKIDVFDDIDGQKLSIMTNDGNEYLITNRKMLKKLAKYAEEDIDIEFTGVISYDAEEGMDVMTIKDFVPSEIVEDDISSLQPESSKGHKKSDDDFLLPDILGEDLPADDLDDMNFELDDADFTEDGDEQDMADADGEASDEKNEETDEP